MPAISSLSLTDGVTPVTLTPQSHTAGETRYRANSAAVRAANPQLVFQYKEANAGVQRQYVRYVEPIAVVDSTTSETLVRGEVIVEFTIRAPAEVTPALRLTAVKRAFDVIGASNLETELTTGEGQWG